MRKTIYHKYKQTEHIRKALSIKLTEPREDSMYVCLTIDAISFYDSSDNKMK